MKRMITLILIAALAAALLTGCNASDYRNAKKLIDGKDFTAAAEILTALGDYRDSADLLDECNRMIEAIDGFTSSALELEEKNSELEQVIADAAAVAGAETPALDESLRQALEDAISEAGSAIVEIPSQPDGYEAIVAETERMEAVDYSSRILTVQEQAALLSNSFRQYELVCDPPEDEVISRLGKVEGITEIAAATEGNDPNGFLHRPGGYTSAVFFTYDRIDQSAVRGKNPIAKGVAGGGVLEVFANGEDAAKRDNYLALYDGVGFKLGSHTIVGTVVVRLSDELTEDQRNELEDRIIAALTEAD